MDLREIGWGDMDWIYLAQNRNQWKALVNTAMNLRENSEELSDWRVIKKDSSPWG
jgi:hypothetical protein